MNQQRENSCAFTQELAQKVIDQISKVVVGQYDFVEKLTAALLTGGHVLVEGVPGLAKTMTAKTLAMTVDTSFKRVQFTPDLMPADIIGTKVFDGKTGEFHFKKGPLFTGILLADEINRTPPKTQAALLEAMEERSVTIDGETYHLEDTFTVIATQNPVEYEGTYPLPEAQLDRFMFKLVVEYIPQKFENMILLKYNEGFDSHHLEQANIQTVCTTEDIGKCRQEIQHVAVSEGMVNYITSITRATRNSPSLALGASPRASVWLMLAAKTYAAMQGRGFVIPEDVKEMAFPVLRHRLVMRPEAGMEGLRADDVLRNILARVEVPR